LNAFDGKDKPTCIFVDRRGQQPAACVVGRVTKPGNRLTGGVTFASVECGNDVSGNRRRDNQADRRRLNRPLGIKQLAASVLPCLGEPRRLRLDLLEPQFFERGHQVARSFLGGRSFGSDPLGFQAGGF
jgi:hypothetical protein